MAVFAHNQHIFAKRWNATISAGGYQANDLFRRGYVRERDFVPLPPPDGVGADWTRPQ